MSTERQFDVTLDAIVMIRVPKVVAASPKEAYEKAVALITEDRQHVSAFRDVARSLKEAQWSEYAEGMEGGVVDVIGDPDFSQTVRVNDQGDTRPSTGVDAGHSPLLDNAIEAIMMQLEQTDSTDWLYPKLSHTLMELRDTRSIIKLRRNEEPNPN